MNSRTNQLRAAGGVLVAAILLAVAWLIFISPRNTEDRSQQDQAALAQDQLVPLKHRLTELRQQNAKLADYEAELAENRKALPTSAAMPDFLRSLHAAGQSTGVAVTDITVGAADKAAGNARV